MMIVNGFTSTKAFRAMMLCLAVALVGAGCAAQGDPEIGVDDGVVASEDLQSTASEVTLREETSEAASNRCIGGPFGNPVPISKEEEFVSCMVTCQSNGGSYSGCHLTCCKKFTGCNTCYLQ